MSDSKDPLKEEQAKKWLATLQDWKERRRSASASPKAKADLSQAQQKISSLEAQLKELSMKSARIEAEAKNREAEMNRLKQEAAGKEAMLARLNEQAVKLRQDFSARLVSLEKEIEEKERLQERESGSVQARLDKAERELAEKERSLHASEERYQEAVIRIQSLTNQLAEKSRELEGLSRSLGRYQSGEMEKNMGGQIHELEKSMAEMSAALAAKEKELFDFKEFLKSREKEMQRTLEEQAQGHSDSVHALQEELRMQKARCEEVEGELSSFRNLLRREEERTRRQDAVFRQMEEERRQLINRLSAMGADIKEYHQKISRHFDEPASGTPVSAARTAKPPLGLADLGMEDVLSPEDPQELLDAELDSIKEDICLESGEDLGED